MEIYFATIGKDGKDDSRTAIETDAQVELEIPEIEFATIGKDGKDDSCVSAMNQIESTPNQNPIIIEL